MVHIVTFLTAGIAVGVISSLFGIGGGTILVPLLSLGFGYPIHQAVAISLVIIIPTAMTGAFRHLKSGNIDWGVSAFVAAGGLLGANVGVDWSLTLPEVVLRRLFVLLLLFMAGQMAFPRRSTPDEARVKSEDDDVDTEEQAETAGLSTGREEKRARARWASLVVNGLLVITGTVMGIVSSLFGIGGGIVVVPVLTLGFRMPIHAAVATSLAVIVPTTVMGAYRHAAAGNVLWIAAGFIAAGGLLGAHAGVSWSLRLKEATLQKLFAALLMVIALRMLF